MDSEGYLPAIRAEVARVLAVDEIDSTYDEQNLFEMGLSSLTAVVLMARLGRDLGLDVDLRTLLEAQTIAGLANCFKAQDRKG